MKYTPKPGFIFATNHTTEKVHVGVRRRGWRGPGWGSEWKTFCEGRSPRYCGPLTVEQVNAIESPVFCKRCVKYIEQEG